MVDQACPALAKLAPQRRPTASLLRFQSGEQLGLGFRVAVRVRLTNPAANSSTCCFARVQSRCPSDRVSRKAAQEPSCSTDQALKEVPTLWHRESRG